jgi:hypothetical protein
MGFVHKTWSGGYRTYLDSDYVRSGLRLWWFCFCRVEARSLGFGFALFADVSVLGGSLCSLFCSPVLISLLSHVFENRIPGGITVSLFFGLDIGGRCRLLADAEPVRFNQSSAFVHSHQTRLPFHRTSNQCTRRGTHTSQTPPPTPPPHLLPLLCR